MNFWIQLIAIVAIAAVVLYVFTALIPLPAKWANVLYAVVGLFLFLYLLSALTGWHGFAGGPVIRQ